MQLHDEGIAFNYQSLLAQPKSDDEWKLALEMQLQHFISPQRLKEFIPRVMQVKTQVATERELVDPPASMRPLDAGFIDLPEKLLNDQRRNKDRSELKRITTVARRLQDQVDRVVILGIGGSYLGSRALFESLKNSYHNELPVENRDNVPRINFEGNGFDNDSLQELLDLLQQTCVNPDAGKEERWAVIVVSKSGGTLETAVAFRAFRRDLAEMYGSKSERFRRSIVPITGTNDSALRNLLIAEGFGEDEIFNIPDRVGGRFSVFSAVGLLPAAVMGLDVNALLQGAAGMTKMFLEEPFERNIPLQYAAICYLMSEELGKKTRVTAVWSRKLEALGLWYDQLLAESLGKLGRGPTPITSVMTRDLHSRGQQHQEGTRDKLITNIWVKNAKLPAIGVGMADRNEDGLNEMSRKNYPMLNEAAWRGANEAYHDVARPTCDIIVPTLSEFNMGQLMQMLMLATVVEGRLMGVNPYGQPGVEAYKRKMKQILKSSGPNMNTTNTAVDGHSKERESKPSLAIQRDG
jgi:glucose-6-phosphate isomerase